MEASNHFSLRSSFINKANTPERTDSQSQFFVEGSNLVNSARSDPSPPSAKEVTIARSFVAANRPTNERWNVHQKLQIVCLMILMALLLLLLSSTI